MSCSNLEDVKKVTNRYTLLENSLAEKKVSMLVNKLRTFCVQEKSECLKSVLLIGGYGKGEGGGAGEDLDVKNNIDILILLDGLTKTSRNIQSKIYKYIKNLELALNVSIDSSFLTTAELMSFANSVFVYDLKEGHEEIYSDKNFDLSILLENVNLDTVKAIEFENLLINRGALILINELMLKSKTLNNQKIRIHISKAIIGLGDYILYKNGMYSWSYSEKRRRFKLLPDAYDSLKLLYDSAHQFRSYDSNGLFEDIPLVELNSQVRDLFTGIFNKLSSSNDSTNEKRMLKNFVIMLFKFRFLSFKTFLKYFNRNLFYDPNYILNKIVRDSFVNESIDDTEEIISIWLSFRDSNNSLEGILI